MLVKLEMFASIKEEAIYALRMMNFVFLRTSLLTSICSLLALTIDRLVALRSLAKRSKKRAIAVSLATLTASTTSMFALYLTMHKYCNPKTFKRFGLIIIPIFTFPSTILFVVAYALIIGHMKRRSQNLHRYINESLKSAKNAVIDFTKAKKFQNIRVRHRNLKRERRLIKLTLCIILCFLVCWLPLSVVASLLATGFQLDAGLVNFSFILAFTNSLGNPTLYFFYMRNSKKNTLKKVLQKTSHLPSNSSNDKRRS